MESVSELEEEEEEEDKEDEDDESESSEEECLRLQFLLRFLDFLDRFFFIASLFLAGRVSGSGSSLVPYA